MSMNKTQLIAAAAKLGVEIGDKPTKETLIESIANFHNEKGNTEELKVFLEENGFTLNDEGEIVKAKKVKKLGENPNTKAFHTIKVLQDESLAGLSYKELKNYLAESEGIETTSSSIAWYANWMKQKGMNPIPRAKKPKAEKPAAAEETAE